MPTLVIPVSAKSNVAAKALEILLERRLTIRLVKKDRIWAECRGSDQVYELGFFNGKWRCTCEEKRGECSHLRALHHVVIRPED